MFYFLDTLAKLQHNNKKRCFWERYSLQRLSRIHSNWTIGNNSVRTAT